MENAVKEIERLGLQLVDCPGNPRVNDDASDVCDSTTYEAAVHDAKGRPLTVYVSAHGLEWDVGGLPHWATDDG